jgi:hypothetical protein
VARTCSECGQDIDFRTIDGRVIPFGCTCSSGDGGGVFWSGVRRVNNTSRKRVRSVHRLQEPDDFCRRSKCPVCGALVCFVRHNGGSVWFDDLGWPWSKHKCFDLPGPRRTHERLDRYARRFKSLDVGLIVEIEETHGSCGSRLVIESVSGNRRECHVRQLEGVHHLIGELTAITWRQRELFLPDQASLGCFHLTEEPGIERMEAGKLLRFTDYILDEHVFCDGDRVFHAAFGEGIILHAWRLGDKDMVWVQFRKGCPRRFEVGLGFITLLERSQRWSQ